MIAKGTTMTALPIPSGPTNREIIDLAYLGLGLSDSMFGRTDEELATGMQLLRAMMGEHPFDQLGFDDVTTNPAEKSGIPSKWLNAVAFALAERIGAPIGKTLSPQFRKTQARSFSQLCAAVNMTPTMSYADNTPRGAGSRRRRFGTFFAGTLENG